MTVMSDKLCGFGQRLGWWWWMLIVCWTFSDWLTVPVGSVIRTSRICSTDCTCVVRTGPVVASLPAVRGVDTTERRVRCLNPAVFTSIDVLLNRSLPRDINFLDFSGNTISELGNRSFRTFPKLEKLNLAKNQISIIREGAFNGLENLLFLNLSFNQLRTVNNFTFAGLKKLEKLLLRGNQLSRLPVGVFATLQALHNLDTSQNLWICDCRLHWLLAWLRTQKIQQMPICQFPPQLRNIRIQKIKPDQWHCKWPLQVPLFDLQPSASQVTFAGDPLTLHCHATRVEPNAQLTWTLNDAEVGGAGELANSDGAGATSETLVAELRPSADGAMLIGSLSVPRLDRSLSGTYTCWLRTTVGENETRSVAVRVLPEGTGYCSESITFGNKGRYVWPPTVTGVLVELPCWSPAVVGGGATAVATSGTGQRGSAARVTRLCGEAGGWEVVDAGRCPYVSEVTKVLEQFARTRHLNITSSSAIESVHRLRNYTADGAAVLRDKMDVVFIARTVVNYLDFVPKHKEVGEALLDIIAVVMLLDESLLREAQLEDRSCSKLVDVVRNLPDLLADGSLSRQHSALLVEQFDVKPDVFQGLTCASFARGAPPSLTSGAAKRVFRCVTGNVTVPPTDDADEMVEAAIRLPASLFRQLNMQAATSQRIQFVVYRNAALFPRTLHPHSRLDVTSGVIGAQLAHLHLANLTEPIFITIRCPHASNGDVTPVWWDSSKNGRLGDWSSAGCSLWNVYGQLVSFRCDRLADFGVLQDARLWASTGRGGGGVGGARFRLLHPVVYVSSGIGVHCLMAAVITYVLGFRLIHLPKKNKHSLINTWLSAILLCLTFTLGVRHTENAKICQGVGLVLHYLTLSCLLWMVISASNNYKKLAKNEYPDPVSDEPPADYPLPPKPMLRFYLLGWGVPVIVCGISGAVNMEDYAGYQYCFLAFTHSVGAFYGPCAALVAILLVFYLLIYCCVRRAEDSRKRSLVTEIELTEAVTEVQPPPPCNNREPSVKSRSEEGGDEEDDAEHGPLSRLRGQVATLFAFLACWAAAAAVTADPFQLASTELGEVLLASCYAVTIIGLGALVLSYHCIAREDVRLVWRLIVRCRESAIVRETEPLPTIAASSGSSGRQQQQQPAAGVSNRVVANRVDKNGGGGARSDDSLTSSFASNRSCPTARSPDAAGNALYRRNMATVMPKISNLDAAIANAGGVTDTSWSGEMFHNPYQNGVARKFFRKHHSRQQQQHHNHHRHRNEYAPNHRTHDYHPDRNHHHHRNDLNRVANLYQLPPLSPPPSAANKVPAPCLRFQPAPPSTDGEDDRMVVPDIRQQSAISVAPTNAAGGGAVSRDRSHESQLFSSSSQGLVSVSPSHSGNFSDRSLLIVEEEEEEMNDETVVHDELDELEATDQDEHDATEVVFRHHQVNAESEGEERDVEQGTTVDWGSCADPSETIRDAIFTPSPTPEQLVSDDDDESAEDVGDESSPLQTIETRPSMGTPEKSLAVNERASSADDDDEETVFETVATNGNCGGSLSDAVVAVVVEPVQQRARGETLPRVGNWDSQWTNGGRGSRQPVYAYVNHSYHQKLADILLDDGVNGASETAVCGGGGGVDDDVVVLDEHVGGGNRRSVVHRSASTGDADLCVGAGPAQDSTTRQSANATTRSDANLWIREPKLKKETAV